MPYPVFVLGAVKQKPAPVADLGKATQTPNPETPNPKPQAPSPTQKGPGRTLNRGNTKKKRERKRNRVTAWAIM